MGYLFVAIFAFSADLHRTKAFSLRRRCPAGADEVSMLQICRNTEKTDDFLHLISQLR